MLKFDAAPGEKWLVEGPRITLPAGRYAFRYLGGLDARETTAPGRLQVFPAGIAAAGMPADYRSPVAPGDFRRDDATSGPAVLVGGEFAPRKRTGKVSLGLHRSGNFGVICTRLEILCHSTRTGTPAD